MTPTACGGVMPATTAAGGKPRVVPPPGPDEELLLRTAVRRVPPDVDAAAATTGVTLAVPPWFPAGAGPADGVAWGDGEVEEVTDGD